VIAKTISLDSSKVVNVTPRYGKLFSKDNAEIVGWKNIELISDRPIEIWLEEFKRCKDQNPDRILIASVMEEYRRDAWVDERCQDAGVDGFEPELLVSTRIARTQDGLCHGRRSGNFFRGLRMGDGRGQGARRITPAPQSATKARISAKQIADRILRAERLVKTHDPHCFT
jgi:hypothetical protein